MEGDPRGKGRGKVGWQGRYRSLACVAGKKQGESGCGGAEGPWTGHDHWPLGFPTKNLSGMWLIQLPRVYLQCRRREGSLIVFLGGGSVRILDPYLETYARDDEN